jgi:hypothetical protein
VPSIVFGGITDCEGWRRLGELNTVPAGTAAYRAAPGNRPVSLPPPEMLILHKNVGKYQSTLSCANPVEEGRSLWKAKENQKNSL